MALEDILNAELSENNRKIIVTKLYEDTFSRGTVDTSRSRGPKNAIYSLSDVYALVGRAIANYDERAGVAEEHKVFFTEEYPPLKHQDIRVSKDPSRIVSVNCIKRLPGAFDRGTPMDPGIVRNRKPRLREEMDDPDHPGYRLAILGYFYDSILRFTCWGKSNKDANKLADRFENLMLDYDWWFKAEGVDRVIFEQRGEDVFLNTDDNKWFGRPLDYFVRTEKIKILSEKSIEQILFSLTVSSDG